MKKYEKGKYLEMTEDEIKALKETEIAPTEPTILERLEAIESVILEGVLAGD